MFSHPLVSVAFRAASNLSVLYYMYTSSRGLMKEHDDVNIKTSQIKLNGDIKLRNYFSS